MPSKDAQQEFTNYKLSGTEGNYTSAAVENVGYYKSMSVVIWTLVDNQQSYHISLNILTCLIMDKHLL